MLRVIIPFTERMEQVPNRAVGNEIVDVNELGDGTLVVDEHSKGAARIRVNRELPHEGTAARDFDNFAWIRGGWEVRRIGIGRNQVAVGCEDQTQGSMQHILIVID